MSALTTYNGLPRMMRKKSKATNEEALDYEVIDNFLPQKEFQEIQTTVMGTSSISTENIQNIQWVYASAVADMNEAKNWKYFYMTHMICIDSIITSPLFGRIIPVLNKLDVKALMRIKCNLYPNSETIYEHKAHTDFPFSHKAAILYINTCNGYTKLKDGTKIDSVANRVLLFDASKPHCSSTTNDQTARFNINFNYF